MERKRKTQEFVISDELWEVIQPLLPVREKPPHPLGCHRPRVPDRQVLNGIFFVLRTGCQWKALDATGICSGSTAHARFQEWRHAGFFARLWEAALQDYDELQGLDWEWLAMDGAMQKAPLGGGKKRSQSDGPRQKRRQTQSAD
jgi:transposase